MFMFSIRSKYYLLLFINVLMIMGLILFVHQRGGVQYLKAKYKQVVKGESVDSANIKFRKIKIESFLNTQTTSDDFFMIGDSITEYGRWAEYMQDCRFKNRGIGGETTKDLRDWFVSVAQKNPEKIFLLIGINNFKAGISSAKEEAYLNDMSYFLSNISEGTQTYLISILPVNEELASNFIRCKNSELAEVNEKLLTLSNKHKNVVFIDLYGEMVDPKSGELPEKYTVDGAHLNYDGYMRYCQLLKDAVL